MNKCCKYTGIVIIIILLYLLCGCSRSEKKPGEIKIGLIAMLSGENAKSGRNMADAAKLAVNSVNRKGGLKVGKYKQKVILIVEDQGGTPEGAMNAARKLIYQDNVTVIIGPQFSSSAIPVARLAESEKVPMIAPMSTHPQTTAEKKYVFRIPYLDTFQGMIIARLAREVLQAQKAAVLYDIAGVYNKTLAEVFKKTFEEAGGVIESFETYTTDQAQDFSAQLQRIKLSSPDVLFLPNYSNDVELQARQAREQGIEAVLLGGDGWDDSQFAPNKDFDDSYMTRHWYPGIPHKEARSFLETFQVTYNRVPGDVSATTYDAFGILFEVFEKTDRMDADSIQQGLYNLDPYNGVTGTIKYTDSGDPVKSAVIIRIKDGGTSVFTVIEP